MRNCTDFPNYAAAKEWFDLYYPHYGDVAKLDLDHDGVPCEGLPGAP
ncbi:excalibur calcium-binding domain-containing protein [Microbacterium sp. K2]